jgi:hypothetical protein
MAARFLPILFSVCATAAVSLGQARADDAGVQQVLNDPAIVAIGQALNLAHGDKCVVPSRPDDVHFACTGAILPVQKPTIQGTGCFFSVEIRCPGDEITRISGMRSWQLLVMPDHKILQSTEPVIVIDSVGTSIP